ncbi:MAG: hypothetical protein KC656_28600, partial [Myxococcales bacterium]|nr:hypothetical protein [Myxococcales bacterium]
PVPAPVAWTAGGGRVAWVSAPDHHLHVLDHTGDLRSGPLPPGPVQGLGLSPDGTRVAVWSQEGPRGSLAVQILPLP